MKEHTDQPKEGRAPKSSPFRPGTQAWGLWLAGQAHVGKGLCPTIARVQGEIADKAAKLSPPGWGKEPPSKI